VAPASRGADGAADALVVAEHAHDARGDLRLGAWHGTMNYAGSAVPCGRGCAARISRSIPPVSSWSFLSGSRTFDGPTAVRTMRAFRAGHPVERVAPLLGDSRQPRLATVPGRRRVARAPARRGRAADDDAGCPDGVRPATRSGSVETGARTHGAPCRGRAPSRGTGTRWTATAGSSRYGVASAPWRGRHPLRTRLRRRDRVRAGDARRGDPVPGDPRAVRACSRAARRPRRKRTRRSRGRDVSIEGDSAVLPSGGPAFHAWRVV
jgi:hypothetical protein